MTARTKEPQYDECLDLEAEKGLATLGLMSNQVWHDDPKRLAFVLARYKFVAKMLAGSAEVLEVGCADAFGTRIVQQEVGRVTALDMDPLFIADAERRSDPEWPLDLAVHDMLDGPYTGLEKSGFDAAYSLDVIEHIPARDEDRFVANIAGSLTPHGVLIIGSPSLASQAHASPASKTGHINCKNADDLKALMQSYFHNVFIFSMNDEVIHTGFAPMAHYYHALCCGRRSG
jgi:2-polyprenyl-3-methyl-5-hydroxy-6-metoxy-1,4-benzoquinol methylase